MKKVLLATVFSSVCMSAFAQSQNPYNYNQEPSVYGNQPVKEEVVYETPYDQSQQYTGPQLGVGMPQKYERPWDLSVMGGVMSKPEYKGSDSNNIDPFLTLNAEYRLNPLNRFFLSMENGLGYGYSLTQNLELGAGLGLRQGRDSSDDVFLSGLADVDDTLTFMAYANYNYGDFNFGIDLEKGLDSSNDGITTKFSAGYMKRVDARLTVGGTVSTVYGNNTYMDQNFSISSADAVAGRPAYDADAGFSEVALKGYVNYNIEGPHNVIATAKYTKLIGDAKDSSVVQDDSNISVTAGYSYEF